MKKIILTVMALIIVLTFTACGGDENAESGTLAQTENVQNSGSEDVKRDPVIPTAKDFKWNLENGVLTISGSGSMPDVGKREDVPWADKVDEIETVIVEDGIRSLAPYSFQGCKNLTSVTLPEGLTKIGMMSFESCGSLMEITIPGSVTYIGYWSFGLCNKLEVINFGGDVATWKSFGGDSELGTFKPVIHCTDGDF